MKKTLICMATIFSLIAFCSCEKETVQKEEEMCTVVFTVNPLGEGKAITRGDDPYLDAILSCMPTYYDLDFYNKETGETFKVRTGTTATLPAGTYRVTTPASYKFFSTRRNLWYVDNYSTEKHTDEEYFMLYYGDGGTWASVWACGPRITVDTDVSISSHFSPQVTLPGQLHSVAVIVEGAETIEANYYHEYVPCYTAISFSNFDLLFLSRPLTTSLRLSAAGYETAEVEILENGVCSGYYYVTNLKQLTEAQVTIGVSSQWQSGGIL